MPQDQFQYVKLPDGSYGKFPANATEEQIRSAIQKDFPDAVKQPSLPQRTYQAVSDFFAPHHESGALEHGTEAIRGTAGGFVNPFLHPRATAEGGGAAIMAGGMTPYGAPMMAITGNRERDEANQRVMQRNQQEVLAGAQQMRKEHPGYLVGQLIGPALLDAPEAIERSAPLVAEGMRGTGEAAQEAAGGIINRTAGTLKEDFANGTNPGKAYLDEGGGMAKSMRDLANKTAAARDAVLERIRQHYTWDTASGRTFDAAEVESHLLSPLDDAIAKAKGAGGRQVVRTQLSELRDSVRQAILSRINRNNGLTALDLFDISEELAHNTPNNAEGTASLLSKIIQSQQEGISSYLKDAIPGLARDIENYNGLKKMTQRAQEMADTRTAPLTHIKDVGSGAGLGDMVGSLLGHKTEGALTAGASVVAGKLARSVPVRTAAARGLYRAGETLGRGADWIDRSTPLAHDQIIPAISTEAPGSAITRGPEAWQARGAQNLMQAGSTTEEINRLWSTRAGQQILQDASDISPNSRAMAAIRQRARNLR